MHSLAPEIKLTFLFALMILMVFAFFIILMVNIYKKRQTQFLIEARLREAEVKHLTLQNQIDKLQAIHDEKERISADIHDDMGGNVASIHLLSKLIQNSNESSSRQEQFKELQIQSLELSQKMRDIIWATKSENDTVENLANYIQQYIVKQLEPLGVVVNVDSFESPDTIEINGEMRKDIFMTVKECFNNIIKHSGATKVHLSLQLNYPYLEIQVKDNGKGLSENIVEGNGIKQMHKRIEKYNGTFLYQNDNGLKTIFKIKISEYQLETIN